jgi:hypothetical protein
VVAAFNEPCAAGESSSPTSVGAVGYPLTTGTPGEDAGGDLTLYRAKASGRNRWVAHDKTSRFRRSRATLPPSCRRSALRRGEPSIRTSRWCPR